jgi:GDP-L-fucose synthase
MDFEINSFLGKKKVLVAGATGLMGRTALVRLSQVPQIQLVANYHRVKPMAFMPDVEWVHADLRNIEACRQIVEGVDYVFMFAGVLSTAPVLARDPVGHVRENMIINAQMLEAAHAAGVKKYVWLSSSTGYPDLERPLTEDDMFFGDPAEINFATGWMTRYTESLCRLFSTKLANPMAVFVLRPTTIFGEYESFNPDICHVLPAMVRQVALKKFPINIWGDGNVSRDWIYAGDLFEVCLLGLLRKHLFEVFNIGRGEQISINQLVERLLKISGNRQVEINHLSGRPSTVRKRLLSMDRIKKEIGSIPMIDFDLALKKMLNACLENNGEGHQ